MRDRDFHSLQAFGQVAEPPRRQAGRVDVLPWLALAVLLVLSWSC